MTAPANQLIAGRVDSTTWYSGVGLIESVDMLIGGVRNQSWVDQTLGGVGTVAETAVWALDPVGALVTAGFGWTVEHVEPLSAALDWLAGDPDQVAANAQTWQNVAAEQAALGADYGSAVRDQLPNWSGPAATAYRDQAGRTLELVTAMSRACDGMAVIVGASGSLVSMVRTLVRDLIGELISILLVRLPLWTAETVGTLGAGTVWVVGQVTALVAKWAAKIASLLKALLSSLRNLIPVVRRLDEIIDTIAALLRRRAGVTPPPRGSSVLWGGAGWADTPQSPRAARTYAAIRDSTGDVSQIAAHTGIRPEVVDQVKKHLFLTAHDVPIGPNEIVHGHFSPLDSVADLWVKATSGRLSGRDADEFRRLLAHEYVESRLMEAGLPYRSAHPDAYVDGYPWPNPQRVGAHDLAPTASSALDPFAHWRVLGLTPPTVTMADDLSNLDLFVELAMMGFS